MRCVFGEFVAVTGEVAVEDAGAPGGVALSGAAAEKVATQISLMSRFSDGQKYCPADP
jgi:hypothetical protein